MIRLIFALLIFTSVCMAQQQPNQNWLLTVGAERELIYVVSTRPLAELYSHPLTSALNQLIGERAYVYASYLGRRAGVGTSSEQLMHTVDQDIQRMQPDRIILDGVEASSYLLELLPSEYHTRTTVISRGTLNVPEDVVKIRVLNLAVVITELIDTMSVFPDTFYILYDSSGLTARESFQLKKNLGSFRIGNIKAVEITTIQELDDFLLGINDSQRGVIINNLMTLRDNELNTEIRLEQIKETITRRNRTHLEIGFNYLPNSKNESVILEFDYPSFVTDYVSEQDISKKRYGFRLIVSKGQMNRLKLKNNYIAALNDIDVLAD